MRILVDGWVNSPHSYAIVNEAQVAAMRQHGKMEPVAFHPGAACDGNETESAVYRIKLPFDFQKVAHLPTFVFATCETQFLKDHIVGAPTEDARRGVVTIITPSEFSRRGLIASGAEPERVVVVPHGVDKSVFHPGDCAGPKVNFTFINVSSQQYRKGSDILLRAFAKVAASINSVRLVLKGCDQLMPSRRLLQQWIHALTLAERRAIAGKITYIGDTLTQWQLAELYRSADCYVTPYRAEAFNLPALEALACGLPIICTAGGPTDSFIEGQAAFRIEAKSIPFGPDGQQMVLEPDVAHLASLMVDMLKHPERRQQQAECSLRCLGWDDVAVKLYDLFRQHV